MKEVKVALKIGVNIKVKWGIRRERQRVLFLAAQRKMFHSMNHLAMDAGYISVGCPEGNELIFSPLSHCTLYALLIYEYTFHTFYLNQKLICLIEKTNFLFKPVTTIEQKRLVQ